jgi:hypothetical protein
MWKLTFLRFMTSKFIFMICNLSFKIKLYCLNRQTRVTSILQLLWTYFQQHFFISDFYSFGQGFAPNQSELVRSYCIFILSRDLSVTLDGVRIGLFDTACNYTSQFTVTNTHTRLHCCCLVTASISGCSLPLRSQTLPGLSYQLLVATAHNDWNPAVL